MSNSFGPDESLFERMTSTIVDSPEIISTKEHIIQVTHRGRSFLARFFHRKPFSQAKTSFVFMIPARKTTYPVLDIDFDDRRHEEKKRIIASINRLNVTPKVLSQLDRENSRFDEQSWASLPHAGTYFMEMTEKLFRYLHVSRVILADDSTLVNSTLGTTISYTPLRFFLGKGSWYKNFGYIPETCPKRDAAQDKLKTMSVSECIDLDHLPFHFLPSYPEETVFEYFAKFARSDHRAFEELLTIFEGYDREALFTDAFCIGTGLFRTFED